MNRESSTSSNPIQSNPAGKRQRKEEGRKDESGSNDSSNELTDELTDESSEAGVTIPQVRVES